MNERTGTSSSVLEQIGRFYNISEIARECSVNPSTVHRWLNRQVELKTIYAERMFEMIQRKITPYKTTGTKSGFTFIDLFAGIGGIRKGFEQAGGTCVFSSEWDSYAQKTYTTNFPSDEPINGDITQIKAKRIPEHDLLLAGFPCQPFSIAGVSKKNALGQPTGFSDKTQGTLFFDVARIIKEKQPKAFVLENVKNLKSHDRGNTFKVITETLTQELGYTIDYKVIDGQSWVPQRRERIVIVGFKNPTLFSLESITIPPKGEIKMGYILHKKNENEPFLEHDQDKYYDFRKNRVQDKYTLTDHLWTYLQNYAKKHKAAGNGFGFGLVTEDDIARTLSARYYKDGSEILVYQGKKKNPRRLTPRECARLMGYPDDFIIPVSDTRAYKQFGNSVIVPLFHTIAKAVKPHIL
ncbi:MAG: DNA (cytosine-5-)-methyltransferase [Bacteroidales bacterium]|jgi:DNA (cytosine-5)-methyltransferase 1|nr:DNA (cytosine-5-)-methyltransferase [Bacteroidales bacterium]